MHVDFDALTKTDAAVGARSEALSFVTKVNDIILTPLILFLLSLALILFLYGLFEYLVKADSDEGRETGKRHILWGFIGLVVMTSAFAILKIAVATFGLEGDLKTYMGS